MIVEYYEQQRKTWPNAGQHILAQYDEQSIIVYQAYNRAIGQYAVNHQTFGGEFSYDRMSWIKPNFLWMMYRSGWGTKPNQEVTLAIRLNRPFFDRLLEQAIASSYGASNFQDEDEWKTAVKSSNVRLQWDPDHTPTGAKLTRKAIQLGLRGQTLQDFGTNGSIEIEDISEFAETQRQHVINRQFDQLKTPLEHVYMPSSNMAIENINLSDIQDESQGT